MYGSDPKVKIAVPSAVGILFMIGLWAPRAAQAQACHGGGHAAHAEPSHSDSARPHAEHGPYLTGGPSIDERPPHGGHVSKSFLYFFEVVYEPNQTHVYLYGPAQEPLPSRSVRGEVLMRPHYLEQTFRFPLKFGPPAAGSTDQNHLAATVDVSRVRDGDMTVTFRFENLPLRPQPKATFTQTFAMVRRPPQVAVSVLTEADRDGLDRQEVCPVTKARLGSMGTPIKVLVGQQPLYLCCRGCVSKVEERPDAYLPSPRTAERK
jgi:hypothetical protein